MKDQLTDLIVKRLQESQAQLKSQFSLQHPIKVARHFVIDNFFPTEIAENIYAQFPKPKTMRLLHSYGELKLKYTHLKDTGALLQSLHHAIQSRPVIAQIEAITGIENQLPDTSKIAGGVSTLLKGYYINPHLDTSHDTSKTQYRTVNLLYYVSPNWQDEYGGNYELWDQAIKNRIVIPSLFNRLLVVETNQTSWHAVNPVLGDYPRRCIFNFFFSHQSPTGVKYSHGSSFPIFNPLFRPRPEEKIRRAIAKFRDKMLGRPW